jgi:RNA polymerase sigma factor (TIGR02999 family)
VKDPGHDITRLLEAAHQGEEGAQDALFRSLHDELRRIAARQMGTERASHTLQPTAVIHEAWLRLFGNRDATDDGDGAPREFRGRQHFLAAASRAMRHILIDHARRRLATKRAGAGGAARLPLTGLELEGQDPDPTEVLAVHEALSLLESTDPVRAEVVQLRYFGGLDLAEIARLLDVSERTIKRRWAFARAWLYRAIGGEDPPGEDS